MARDKTCIMAIMAVDDETNIREVLERGLARAGYHCVTASSAGEAAHLLQREDFALVLLDITMPGKSGMELLPEIIAQYPDTGVVMLTGVTDTATAVRAMREGALDYVTKPFNLDELTTRMENALTRRALVLQNRRYQEKLARMVTAFCRTAGTKRNGNPWWRSVRGNTSSEFGR